MTPQSDTLPGRWPTLKPIETNTRRARHSGIITAVGIRKASDHVVNAASTQRPDTPTGPVTARPCLATVISNSQHSSMIYSNCDTSPPMIPMIPVTRLTGAAADGPRFSGVLRAAGSSGERMSGDEARGRGEQTAHTFRRPPPRSPLFIIQLSLRCVVYTEPASYRRRTSAISFRD